MIKEQMNKIKKMFTKMPKEKEEVVVEVEEEKPKGKLNKKKTENLVAFLIILIVTLIAINTILKKDSPSAKDEDSENSPYKVLADMQVSKNNDYSDELETRLEKILETMVGVRKS